MIGRDVFNALNINTQYIVLRMYTFKIKGHFFTLFSTFNL